MDKKRILIARAIDPATIERLRAHFEVETNHDDTEYTREQLSARLAGKWGVLSTAGEPFDAAMLDAHPQLRALCLMTVGYNNVDVPACTARGILASNAPGVLTETTADLGFALMMAAARRITEGERYLREGRWTKWSWDLLTGSDIHGATLGILGMGRIGQAIARRGHLGFGMKVIYHNRSRLPEADEAPIGARWVDKATLMRESDHLVLVVPYTPASRHSVGAAELALMKRTATLTNVARGGIVDDAALAEALREGRIAAAALDVFENEPNLNPALLEVPNVVLTPHIGSATVRTRRAMSDIAADNLIAAATGALPPTALNPEVLPLKP